jgi:hypothetical protein
MRRLKDFSPEVILPAFDADFLEADVCGQWGQSFAIRVWR